MSVGGASEHEASRWGSIALALGVLVASALPCGKARADFPEYVLKGEFIERFTRFIDWPEGTFSSADAPFVLCVAGENPFGDYLDRLARERKIKDRTVVVSHPSTVSQFDGCHLAFIARTERRRLEAIVAETEGKPILTIGDTDGFAKAGILINFYLERDLVRFEVNVEKAKQSGLKFSSQLMKLAHVVSRNQDHRGDVPIGPFHP